MISSRSSIVTSSGSYSQVASVLRQQGLSRCRTGRPCPLPWCRATAIDVERRAAGKDLAAADLVRVTVTEIFAARFVTPALQHLRVHHPEIDVEVLPDHRKLVIGRRQARYRLAR